MADHMILRYRGKADKWVQQAEKAQRRVYMDTITRFKFQDASYYHELAAQCFRVAKRFQDAGVAYKSCGRMEQRLKKPEVAASFYHEAALCFQKDDPQEAASCYLTSINLYCQIRRFSTAARLETKVADIMEKDRNRPLAIAHNIKAADFYGANTCCGKAADRCLLKAAHDLSRCERYMDAATLFEEVGHRMLSDDLLKFNSPDTFLRALLCLLCASGLPEAAPVPHKRNRENQTPTPTPPPPRPTINSVRAKVVCLAKVSPVFQGSRACLFASDVSRAGLDGNLDLFASSVYAYNNICRLDSWCLGILKIIAGHVEERSISFAKMRAKQDKLRRRQLAEERAIGRLKKQGSPSRLIEVGDGREISSEGSDASSSQKPRTDKTQETSTRSRSSTTPSSASRSSTSSTSGSSSSSGSGGSSSSSSSADVVSPTEKCGSGSTSGSGSDDGRSDTSEGGDGQNTKYGTNSHEARKMSAKRHGGSSKGISKSKATTTTTNRSDEMSSDTSESPRSRGTVSDSEKAGGSESEGSKGRRLGPRSRAKKVSFSRESASASGLESGSQGGSGSGRSIVDGSRSSAGEGNDETRSQKKVAATSKTTKKTKAEKAKKTTSRGFFGLRGRGQ